MAVCEFRVAVNSGKQDDKPYFGQVLTFGRIAEVCRDYLKKGSQVLVDGKLQNDEWEDRQTGQKRTQTRIIADTVQFVGRSDNSRQNEQSGPNYGRSEYHAPAPQRASIDSRFAPPVQDTEPEEDGIPF
jgi:single-strand DNA-binding protein